MLLSSIALAFQVATPGSAFELLPPGEHRVGFTQRWLIDSTRRLPSGERYGLRYRPVLMNMWYPASVSAGRPVQYRDYIDGAGRAAASTPLRTYAADLVAYQRTVSWRELARTPRDSTAPALGARIDSLFGSAGRALRDAPRLAGRHHVVVYTQGAGSSLEDNVLFCEYLAGRGYTVIGSAFPAEANDRFSTNASDESRQRDMKRLLLEYTRMTDSDPGPVTVVGHSAGAQASFLMATDPTAPIDALLSLDTTQDYAGLSDRAWSYFTDRVVEHRSAIRIPIVFAAGPEALFELADSMSASPRTLVTVRGLSHNDYISQGVLRRRVRAGLDGDNPAVLDSAEQGYRALAIYLADWLDAFHGRQASASPQSTVLSAAAIKPGDRMPALIPSTPVTAREVRHLFATSPPEEFADRAIRARAADPAIASDGVFMMLAVDAVRRGNAARARVVLKALRDRDATVARVEERIEDRARLFERVGATDLASEWRRVLTALKGASPPHDY